MAAPSAEEQALMAEFERRRRAKNLVLPTEDIQVKVALRRCSHPICLFGEDVLDRRERLRHVLSKKSDEEVQHILHGEDDEEARGGLMQGREDNTTWYHVGPEALRDARVQIADYSLARAGQRLAQARIKAALPPEERARIRQASHKWIQSLHMYGSQVSGLRATSSAVFSPDSQHLISANWSGQVTVWTMPDCNEELRLIGHNSQVGCAKFHPAAYTGADPLMLNAASCDHDGRVLLWSLVGSEPLGELDRHAARVSRLAFHPSGRFLGTCCFDSSWRLFDLERLEEVLFQEGHSKAVFDLEFQIDGSLALTGGFDAYGRVWDLRTGRCIMFLEGHQKDIHAVGWHLNGYTMVTGSADNTCKVWDLRMRRCVYTIPAHQSLVSKLQLDPVAGEFLVTGSYDNTIKLWTTAGWQPLKVLEGNGMKVTSVDVSPDGKWVSSSCFDHTFKLWA